uniref:Uncharacterized protein n=3 Tax=Ditylum brightwellii TaxID=49249 RepID=A0A6V2AZ66_9STRA
MPSVKIFSKKHRNSDDDSSTVTSSSTMSLKRIRFKPSLRSLKSSKSAPALVNKKQKKKKKEGKSKPIEPTSPQNNDDSRLKADNNDVHIDPSTTTSTDKRADADNAEASEGLNAPEKIPVCDILSVLVLAMDPVDRVFEMFHLEFNAKRAIVLDVLDQIPLSADKKRLQNMKYDGVCDRSGTEMKLSYLINEYTSGNDVFIAIPEGYDGKKTAELAAPILKDEEVNDMVRSTGIPLSAVEKNDDTTLSQEVKREDNSAPVEQDPTSEAKETATVKRDDISVERNDNSVERDPTLEEENATLMEPPAKPAEHEVVPVSRDGISEQKEATHVERDNALEERESSSADQDVTHIEQDVTPTELDVTRIEQGITPTEQDVTHLEQVSVSDEIDTTLPDQEPASKEKDAPPPLEQDISPKEKDVIPVEQNATPTDTDDALAQGGTAIVEENQEKITLKDKSESNPNESDEKINDATEKKDASILQEVPHFTRDLVMNTGSKPSKTFYLVAAFLFVSLSIMAWVLLVGSKEATIGSESHDYLSLAQIDVGVPVEENLSMPPKKKIAKSLDLIGKSILKFRVKRQENI